MGMTRDDVRRWLEFQKLGLHAEMFFKEGITGKGLADMTFDLFKEKTKKFGDLPQNFLKNWPKLQKYGFSRQTPVPEIKTVTFKTGKTGMRVTGNRITTIYPGTQAFDLGIHLTWKIIGINGNFSRNNTEQVKNLFKKAIETQNDYKVMFSTHVSQYTVKFSSSTDNEWGCKFNHLDNWNLWKITNTAPGKQAHKLGVKVDDSIFAVDGKVIDEKNFKLIGEKLLSGKSCSIKFQREGKVGKKELAKTSGLETISKVILSVEAFNNAVSKKNKIC